jgi:ParB family chromosome partitioning protein
MSKATDLKEKFGGRIAATIGAPASTAAPEAKAAGPLPTDGMVRNRSAALLDINRIVCDPQPREHFDEADLHKLSESIRSRGVLQSLRVRWCPERGAWVVVCGERRLRAAKMAGLTAVPCILIEGEVSDADRLIDQLAENLLRSSLLPIEEAKSYRQLMELNGWTAAQLAESLHVSPSGVSRALALLKLPEDVQEQVEAGAIKPSAAYELSKLESQEQQREVAAEVAGGTLDAKGTAKKVRQKKGKAARPAAPRRETYRDPGGVSIEVLRKKKHTDADVAQALRRLADRLEGQGRKSEAARRNHPKRVCHGEAGRREDSRRPVAFSGGLHADQSNSLAGLATC